ncbi:MAG: BamA/TamA family outer membrane protein, partial [Candidatus Competibacterales bacterium]|nr:BamA/TamA family outer membrane protein [Candidatus Competibacterales bacterium]
ALIDASPEDAVDRVIPVTVQLSMRKRSEYSAGLGYATDTGIRGRIGLQRRWVNRRGHKLELQLRASQITYGLAAAYTIPGNDPRTDAYLVRAKIDGEDSDRKESVTASLGLSRRFQRGFWTHLLSLDYQWEEFEASGDTDSTALLIPSIRSTRIDTDDRLRVSQGSALTLELRGAAEPLLSDLSFTQARADVKWIHSLTPDHRLILRGQAGTTLIADEDFPQLPTSLRFYAGGDSSVRGYALDSIGPRDAAGEVIGGRHLLVGSFEYEYRLFGDWSVAAFVDTGDAFDDGSPELRTGAGLGLRWQSPVGPVRLDLAHGFDDPGDNIRLHFSLGPEL